MQRIFSFIANQLALLTLLGALLAYLHPPLFLVFKHYFLWFFAATMFALGLVLDAADIKREIINPKRIALGVLAQFSVMPLLAFLAGGAVAFSVTLTTVATLLSPLLTPLLVKWLGGAILPVEFLPLMLTIVQTVLLPLMLGLVVQRWLGRLLPRARGLAPGVAALAIIIICSYAVAANQARISEMVLPVLLGVVLVNILGYLTGWYLGRWYGFSELYRITLMIELGMQNAGMGVALALQHFPPEAALPGALFAVWCIITAAISSSWLRRRMAQRAAGAPVSLP